MVAIDFYPLPKHCISFRLHQRHNPSFRIFFITLNSPPAFVEVFCLKRDEVKCAPMEEIKWGRKTSRNLWAQILIDGVWFFFFFLSELLLGYPVLLRSIWNYSAFLKKKILRTKVCANVYISTKFLERKNDLQIVWDSQPGSIISV